MKTPQPGEVYVVDLGFDGKVRPMIIVSRKDENAPRALVLAVPITSQYRNSPYEIDIGKPQLLKTHSYVNVQGLQSLKYTDLGHRIGGVSSLTLEEY